MKPHPEKASAFPFIAIAAMAENRVIGKAGSIPWHLPEDFRWFRKMTTGKIIIMGRKTFESIGTPLPGRTTWVLTRQPIQVPGIEVFHSLAELIARIPHNPASQPVICGGAEIYQQTLHLCSDIYLTIVNTTIPEGDTFFPEINESFKSAEIIMDRSDFRVVHFKNRLYSD
jgi:dihydrofolate reductase